MVSADKIEISGNLRDRPKNFGSLRKQASGSKRHLQTE
jgi:hypothetical protein